MYTGNGMKPKSAEYDIGMDAYGRSVTLKFLNSSNNKEVWDIHIEAADQRDDCQKVSGLSTENLRAICQIINSTYIMSRDATT